MGNNLLQEAAAAGIDIAIVPFIRVEPVKDAALTATLSGLALQNIMAVFTSLNALDAVQLHLPQAPAAWSVACINGRTLAVAKAFFGEAAIRCTAGDATGLAAEITAQAPAQVVFFCGDQRLQHLPEALLQHHVPLTEITVYHTRATPVALPILYRGILFFSPSAVHSFFSLNKTAANCTVFAIGQTTAEAVKIYTSNNLVISPANDAGTMLRHVINYYNEERLITEST